MTCATSTRDNEEATGKAVEMVLAGVHAEACYVQDNEGQHASVEELCDSRLQQCKT